MNTTTRIETIERTERPWGWYETVSEVAGNKVKRIRVHPGQQLSLQKHHQRAEHWVVVSGSALVRNGDKEFMVTENESTYIPVGVIHSLENPGKIALELIEVRGWVAGWVVG